MFCPVSVSAGKRCALNTTLTSKALNLNVETMQSVVTLAETVTMFPRRCEYSLPQRTSDHGALIYCSKFAKDLIISYLAQSEQSVEMTRNDM